jgi:ribosomal protein S15P/S13E
MAKIMVKIEKEDVKTTIIGLNIEVYVNDNFSLVFSPEALDELINDYNNLKEHIKKV